MNVIKREGKVVNNKQCVCSEREIRVCGDSRKFYRDLWRETKNESESL
jgi:hypothetical protein